MSDTEELEHTAKSLEDALDPDEIVITVDVGGVPLEVSRKAKNSMSSAQDAMASQPTVFYKCDFAITAVTDILKYDKLQFSFPFSEETINSFDWDSVIVGRSDSYPKGKQPETDEFAKVMSVHGLVKEEKDAQARAMGVVKSGVQSYCTYKQRWKQWRDICAVYRFMNPSMQIQTVYDLIKGRIKHCGSLGEINDKIDEDVQKHINKLKRETSKRDKEARLQKELEDAEAARQQAAAEIEESKQQESKIQEETQEIQNATYEGSRSQSAAARTAALEAKKAEADTLKEKQAEAKKQAAEQAKKKRELQKALNEQRKVVVVDDEPKTKKLKRNDTSLLKGAITPRKKAELDGDGWKPPTKQDSAKPVFDPPGNLWLQDSQKKLKLLFSLARELKAEDLLEPPLAFPTLMDFIGADSLDVSLSFHDRVFLYLNALVLSQKR